MASGGLTNKFHKFLAACIACRDAWHAESPEEEPRDAGFTKFVNWVLEIHESQEPSNSPAKEAVFELLKIILYPKDHTAYRTEDLRKAVMDRKEGRSYRAVLASDVAHDEEDFRVRHFVEAVMDKKKKHPKNFAFSLGAIVCAFFTNREGFPVVKKRSKVVFTTEPCTRFQQLLFLSAIANISSILSSRRTSKRRKIASDTSKVVTRLENVTSLTDVADRIGCAVQAVVHGWDILARCLGFKDAEGLVALYARISSSFVYKTVKDRSEGFLPSSQATSLTLDVELTTVRNETWPKAFDRSASLDGLLRELVDEFYKDLYGVVEADELYSTSESVRWSYLDNFNPQDPNLPRRFLKLRKGFLNDTEKKISGEEGVNIQLAEERRTRNRVTSNAGSSATSRKSKPRPPKMSESEVAEAKKVVRQAMKPYVRLYNCSFSELLEAVTVLYPGEDITGKVQLVLTDPPYNVRRERGSSNAAYDFLTVEDMGAVVTTCAELLRPGGHFVLSCSQQQVNRWKEKFRMYNQCKTFTVDKVGMIFERHPSNYSTFPGRRSTSLQNAADFGVHAMKKGGPKDKAEAMVNFVQHGHVASTMQGFKNVINNIMPVPRSEQVRVPNKNGKGTHWLRPEQKPLSVMKEAVCRFTQPGDIVSDNFGGTFSSGIGSFSVDQHRRFVGCELDEHCYSVALDHLIKAFCTAFAQEAGDISLPSAAQRAAKDLYERHIAPRREDPAWKAPKSIAKYQALPPHIIAHLSSQWGSMNFFTEHKSQGVHEWPLRFQRLLHQADFLKLRDLDAATYDVVVAPTTIQHPNAGLGLFATRTFSPGEHVCPFYGTPVYHNLWDRTDETKTYGEGILAVTAKRFRRYAVQIPVDGEVSRTVRDYLEGTKSVCIVPARFCAAG